MTVRECYEQAVSLIPERPDENPDMQRFAATWCNILLVETFRYENIFRMANDLPQLEEIPKIELDDDIIPYNEQLVRAVFPYGMARFVFRENDDISASREFYQLYVNALSEVTPLLEDEITDVYG